MGQRSSRLWRKGKVETAIELNNISHVRDEREDTLHNSGTLFNRPFKVGKSDEESRNYVSTPSSEMEAGNHEFRSNRSPFQQIERRKIWGNENDEIVGSGVVEIGDAVGETIEALLDDSSSHEDMSSRSTTSPTESLDDPDGTSWTFPEKVVDVK
jgi:hypothetical protein